MSKEREEEEEELKKMRECRRKRDTAKGLHAVGLCACLHFCRCSGPGNSMSGKVKEIQGWAGPGISVSRSNPQRCEGKGGGERKKWWYWRRLWNQGDKISGEVEETKY